jgi:hypothetical protein
LHENIALFLFSQIDFIHGKPGPQTVGVLCYERVGGSRMALQAVFLMDEICVEGSERNLRF